MIPYKTELRWLIQLLFNSYPYYLYAKYIIQTLKEKELLLKIQLRIITKRPELLREINPKLFEDKDKVMSLHLLQYWPPRSAKGVNE